MDCERVCFGCFLEKENQHGACAHCGFDPDNAEQPLLALPMGTVLGGRYLTGRVLGMGGFGITYLGFDLTLEITVAIKEYLPNGIAARGGDGYSMTVLSSREKESFRNGQDRFLDEARILAKLQNEKNIVSVQNFFQENNTAYFVMEYIDGMSLKEYVEREGGRVAWDEALRLLLPVMSALCEVHALGLLHRDISPDNIYVTKDGGSKLLDFGAARSSLDGNRSMSVILKHGFAPPEQYTSHGNQGPWTDIYAMGATLYRIVTGVCVPDAIDRINSDTMQTPSQLGVRMPPQAENALIRALSPRAEARFSNMRAFIAALAVILPLSLLGKSKSADTPASAATGGMSPGGATTMPIASPTPMYTAAPTAEPTPEPTPEPPELVTYTNEELQFSVKMPEEYEAAVSDDGTVKLALGSETFVGIMFIDYLDIMPIYRVEDFAAQHEAATEYLMQYVGCTEYKKTSADYVTEGDKRFFRVECSAVTAQGQAITLVLSMTDAKGEFGCYLFIYSVENGTESTELLVSQNEAIIASFEATGEVKRDRALFRSDSLKLQAIYTPSLCKGGIREKAAEEDGSGIDCAYFYPIAGELNSMIELEYADTYGSTPEEAMDYLHKLVNKTWKIIETGEQEDYELGVYKYLMRKYAAELDDGTVIIVVLTSAEIEGETLVFGAFCTEEYAEASMSLLIDLMRTVRPYAPGT